MQNFNQVKRFQEQAFKAAPVGSQVVFTNLDARAKGRAYEHENTIKLEEDLFIAHGITPGMPFVTRKEIYAILIQDAYHGSRMVGDARMPADERYENDNLYISQVVTFDLG